MRTWKIMTKPDKDAVLCRYFEENTTAAKCMYNVANFFIRNTMTGMRKSPESQTSFIHSKVRKKKKSIRSCAYYKKYSMNIH